MMLATEGLGKSESGYLCLSGAIWSSDRKTRIYLFNLDRIHVRFLRFSNTNININININHLSMHLDYISL